jgi:hypothetical protein
VRRMRWITAGLLSILNEGYSGQDNDVCQRRKPCEDGPWRTFTGALDRCDAN